MVRPNYKDYRRSVFAIVDNKIEHSAKGSTWDEHKYIKRVDGTYYYPDSYEGGRHLPDDQTEDKDKSSMEDDLYEKLKGSTDENIGKSLRENFDKILKDQLGVDWTKLPKEEVDRMQRSIIDRIEGKSSKEDLSEKDVENLAKEVIRGNFGNGQQRKDLLGENYEKVQKQVNEMVKGSTGSKKVSEATEDSIKKVEEVVKTVSSSSTDSKVHSGVDMEEVQSVYNKNKKNK